MASPLKVSVIIPVYNTEKYLKETINSVLNQSFENFEIILVDDCSIDGSLKIMNEITKQDKRITVLRNKINKGKNISVNKAFKYAKGTYITLLDSDDLFYPGRLKKQVEFLDKHPKIDMVYGNIIKLLKNGKEKFREAINLKEDPLLTLKRESKNNKNFEEACRVLDPKDYIPASSVMFRKKIIDNGIKMDENLRNSEDYDLWFQIIGKGYKIKKMDIITYKYRLHPNQKSGNKEKMQKAKRYILKKLRRGEYFQ